MRPPARPAPPLPPKQLLLFDLHEVKEVEDTLGGTQAWANEVQDGYDYEHGKGTFSCSALHHFLDEHLPLR